MALKFAKKGDAVTKAQTQEETQEESEQETAPVKPGPSFLKTGDAAKEAMAIEKKKAEDRAKEIRRFYVKVGEEERITFLSGILKNGTLDVPMWYEHMVKIAGRFYNPICVSEHEPCPLCAIKPSVLVAGFSVIDHGSWKSKVGTVYKDQIKLLICKPTTFKLLQMLAAKKGGLMGRTFDVGRSSDKVANVGDIFTYDDAIGVRTIEQLNKQYGDKDKIIKPVNFNDVLIYRTSAELEAEGFVVANQDDMTDYSKDL